MAETFQCPSCVCPTWSLKPVRLHSSALAFKMAVCPQNFHMHNIQDHGYLITTAKFGFAISTCIWFLLAWKHQMGSLRYRLLNKETPVRESIVGLGPDKLVKCPSISEVPTHYSRRMWGLPFPQLSSHFHLPQLLTHTKATLELSHPETCHLCKD